MIWHPFTQGATSPEPLHIVKGEGAFIFDKEGKSYLDLISSWWVTLHGHGHPVIAKAIYEQAKTLEQVIFAGCIHTPAIELSQKICQLTNLHRVFFSDDGSTAVEVALKMSYQYFWNLGEKQRTKFISLEGGYHGDTMGGMSVGKESGFFQPFQSLLFETLTIPYPHNETHTLEMYDQILREHKDHIAALILEPLIQGVAGMRMYSPTLLQALCERARQDGILVIFDEVMTGFGRTGKMFAFEHIDFLPDFLCLAKGLTGGFLPMALTVTTEKIYKAFLGETFDKAFAHGHSYTGSPLGCAAALASLSLFTEETWKNIGMIERIHQERQIGRCLGTIAAFEPKSPTKEIAHKALKEGFFLRPLKEALYLLPPYCIQENDLHKVYDFLEDAVS